MKILMAEDDLQLLQAATVVLRMLGHSIVHAVDAAQVQSAALREKPDLILLDISMPGGKGTDVLGRLKHNSITSGIPVVVISGTQDPAILSFIAEAAVGFIPKPCKLETLAQDLRQITPYLPW